MSAIDYEIAFESEINVLSCIMKKTELLWDIDVEKFASQISKNIYNAIKNLVENKLSISIDNIVCQHGESNIRQYVEHIWKYECNPDDFQLYWKRIKERYAVDKLNDFSKNISDDLKNKKSLSDFNKYQDELTDILNNSQNDNTIPTFNEIGDRYESELRRRVDGRFYSYGDSRLDRITIGAVPGQMTAIFGPTGSGKSAYGLMLFNKQINKNIPAILLTLEMDEISTMDRLVAMRCRIPVNTLLMRDDKDIGDSIIDTFNEERKKLEKNGNRFFIIDKPGISLLEVESVIMKCLKLMNTDYAIVTIDLFTMIKEASTAKASDIEYAINKLHEIAKRCNVHIINVIQANRAMDDKPIRDWEDVKKVSPKTTRNIKNSGAIEERNRVVLAIWRPMYYYRTYFPDDDRIDTIDDILEVRLLKANQSATGASIKYIFYGDEMLILPFIDDEDETDNSFGNEV